MQDASFIGKGRVFMGPTSGAALFEVGNVSSLTFGVAEEEKPLLNYKVAGGGKANSIKRITAVTIAMALHDINTNNLSVAMYGDTAAVTAAAITDEVLTLYKGGFTRTAYQIDTSVAPVVTNSGGGTTYTVDTDYEVLPGGLFIPTTSTIVDASSNKIDYTKKAGNVVEALTNSAQEYKLYFVGLNEAQSGKPVTISVHRFKPGPLSNFGVIADDYAALEISGEALADSTITAANTSQYFRMEFAS